MDESKKSSFPFEVTIGQKALNSFSVSKHMGTFQNSQNYLSFGVFSYISKWMSCLELNLNGQNKNFDNKFRMVVKKLMQFKSLLGD